MPMLENKDNNLHRLTSTTNKKKANILKRLDTKCKDKVDADLSGISPIKSPPASKRRVNFEKTTKPPSNSRLKDMEAKCRRYESEARSQRSRIHSLTQQLQEKDKIIRNLEHKLPQVLADVSRGIHHTREAAGKKKSMRDVREAMNRNHILNQKIKELEQKLESQKESVLQIENERLRTEIKSKDKVIRQNSTELVETRQRVNGLEDDISRLHGNYFTWQKELISMRNENDYLYDEIRVQYNNLIQTEEELNSIDQIVDGLKSLITGGRPEIQETPACNGAKTDNDSQDTSGLQNFSGKKRRRWNNTWPLNFSIASPLLKESEDELDTRHLLELVDEQFSSDEAEGDVDENLIFNQGEEEVDNDIFDNEENENSWEDELHQENSDVEKTSDWSSSDEFENSAEKSQFCSRMEELDLKLEFMLNKLNSTANPNTTTNIF